MKRIVRSPSGLVSNGVSQPVSPFVTPEGCDYTIEQLKTWQIKLVCCKDTLLYLKLGINAQTMNKYLGLVMSAINYPSNPCYYESLLPNDFEQISNFIILITNSGQC